MGRVALRGKAIISIGANVVFLLGMLMIEANRRAHKQLPLPPTRAPHPHTHTPLRTHCHALLIIIIYIYLYLYSLFTPFSLFKKKRCRFFY